MSEKKKYWGKYRGTVFNNIDPEFRGRIQAMVADVSALLPTSWALPCVPMATLQGGVFVMPRIGDGVWMLTTVGQNAVVVSDTPIPPMMGPGVMLMGGPMSYISVSPDGIMIVAPQIQINGEVIVNFGALAVTP